MKKHRILTVALAAAMALGSLYGCGTKDSSQQAVTPLKMILVGEKPAIYDEIYGKLNEMLRQDIGAELNIEYYNYSDLKQKYSLLFSSGEDFDIVFSADWVQYNQQAAKNSFMEITDDMLKKNAPKTYEQMTDKIKNEVKVNGKMYMIPNTAKEYSTRVAIVRGDLREKYGMEPLKNADDFEKYLEAVAKNESDIIPLVNLEAIAFWMKPYLSIPKSTEIAYEVEDGKFVKKDFQDWYVDSIKKTRSLVDKGIIPQDISVNKTISSMFENGKCATSIKNLETTATFVKQQRLLHPEWKIEVYDFSKGVPKIVNSVISNGLSLSRTTKKADKALQLIELLRNDKRYFDLTWYGIEGKHWKADGDNGYISLDKDLPSEERYEPGCVWGWKNESMLRTSDDEIPEKQEILQHWINEDTIDSDVYGFVFDDSNVKTEIATVSSVASQYGGPLYNGMIESGNIDASIAEYREKLEQAGIDKIYDEVQRQYEEYKKK